MKNLVLILAFALAGCAATCPVDSKPCPVVTPTCATACAKGEKLGCAWATPTPLGATCEEFCENAGITVPWDVAKLTSATSCK